jgi:hypothetical protein
MRACILMVGCTLKVEKILRSDRCAIPDEFAGMHQLFDGVRTG